MNLFHRKKVSRTSRVLSGVTSAMMALSAFSGLSANTALKASAATTNWKFDLGGSGAASGYTGVSAYDPAQNQRDRRAGRDLVDMAEKI